MRHFLGVGYGMALFFFVLFYTIPAGMVLLWTLNNLFAFGRNVMVARLRRPRMASGMGVAATG
jgi:membrane protein insertase Oxa1/YidC/SpoIIIJ